MLSSQLIRRNYVNSLMIIVTLWFFIFLCIVGSAELLSMPTSASFPLAYTLSCVFTILSLAQSCAKCASKSAVLRQLKLHSVPELTESDQIVEGIVNI